MSPIAPPNATGAPEIRPSWALLELVYDASFHAEAVDFAKFLAADRKIPLETGVRLGGFILLVNRFEDCFFVQRPYVVSSRRGAHRVGFSAWSQNRRPAVLLARGDLFFNPDDFSISADLFGPRNEAVHIQRFGKKSFSGSRTFSAFTKTLAAIQWLKFQLA